MKQFLHFFAFIFVVTGLSLGYVASKVEAIKLSYEIRAKEQRIAQQYEDQRNLKYELAALKSPAQLENRMLDTNLELVPVKEVHVLRFAKKNFPAAQEPIIGTDISRPTGGFLSVPEAQANPDS